MCGICGIVGKPDKQIVEAMTKRMVHRGPDCDGFYLDADAALGMRRLKIIDLNTGDQPIHNEEQSVWVIFNGEIYNFKSLRRQLETKGHCFYTQSDTEVIVHLYEEYAEDFPKYLEGMFAVAVWDKNNKRLLLCRDRLGIKPLYYHLKDGQISFASEISALLENKAISRDLDWVAVDNYLTFLYIPAPLTIYRDIKKLLPGKILSFQKGKAETKTYWELTAEAANLSSDENYHIEKIRGLLNHSISSHMLSDVPLGALLSGGLDSSCVVGLMSKFSERPVETFSFGFEQRYSSYNELDYARQVAKLFNCRHHEFILRPDIEKTILRAVEFIDEPFADSSAILNLLVTQEARRFVTVALSGIGGDEVFGGYPRYSAAMSLSEFRRLPLFLRQGLQGLSKFIPESRQSGNPGGRLKRYLAAGTLAPEEAYVSWMMYFDRQKKSRLYSDDFKARLIHQAGYVHFDYFAQTEKGDFADRANFVDLMTYLPDDLLIMADRMSMANSLELRVPLCDHKLVEYLALLPFALKMRGLKMKYLFKKLLCGLLPENILNKRKQGFSLPLADWLREDLKGILRETLSEDNLKRRGWFNPGEATALINGHLKGKQVNTHQLWALLILELWFKNKD
ncbi:MAG: asparagine synthase (glutamine-hydrolyzing) [Candidatus Omnitrophota bacterium]